MALLRTAIIALVVCCGGHVIAAPMVTPEYRIEMPRDSGSHPQFNIEWWYVTGWLQDSGGKQRGFQVTFFRLRNSNADDNPSKFSPAQILFAHAALSDPSEKKLLRAERTARAGFGLAEAEQASINVWIDGWSLHGEGADIVAQVSTPEFALALKLQSTQPILLEGDQGYSRKGPDAAAASHYYSLPHMNVHGSIAIHGNDMAVTGQAWFDHEWSNMYQDEQSVGWDWIGINLNDGGALMAFRMRDAQQRQRWANATLRKTDLGGTDLRSTEQTQSFGPEQLTWTPLRNWRSPRTGVQYPVEWRVKVGQQELLLRPLMDDQENDARHSVGILYWEGAVEATDTAGHVLGRGYLELTGYGEPARF